MKIDKITLTNFRCYGPTPVEIPLESGLTTFVGNNGSGKTAIFSALAKLFGINPTQRAITKRDFHIPLGTTDLASGATIAIDCVLSFPEVETGDDGEGDEEGVEADDDDSAADDSAVPNFFHHMAASDENAPLAVRMRLQATWTEDGTPEGTIEEEVRWIQTLGNDFEWLDCRKVQVVERSLELPRFTGHIRVLSCSMKGGYA